VRPAAVDVCSGVEAVSGFGFVKGRKDSVRMHEFFAAVHSASTKELRSELGGSPGAKFAIQKEADYE
jgi:hypothetical protein